MVALAERPVIVVESKPIRVEVPPRPEVGSSVEDFEDEIKYGAVKTDELTIFPQIRVLFEDIDVLADDIAKHRGLIQPITVALLTEEQALKYVEGFNYVWDRNVVSPADINWVTYKGKKTAKILIDGERRTKAYQRLEREGCTMCQAVHGEGSCITRHIPDSKMRATLRVGTTYFKALEIQYSANLSRENSAHEKAEALRRGFRAKLLANPNYTYTQYAKDTGRARSTIIDAMQYGELPESLKNLVAKKRIDYGHAVVLHRLQVELGYPEEELLRWAVAKIAGPNRKVAEFKKYVENHIKQMNSGQTMLEIFTEEQERAMRKAEIRDVAAAELVKRVWQNIAYANKILGLVGDGLIGKEDSPFAASSPQKVLARQVSQLVEINTHLPGLSLQRREEAEGVLQESAVLLRTLVANNPDNAISSHFE